MKLDMSYLIFGIFCFVVFVILVFTVNEKYLWIFPLASAILLLLKSYYGERMRLKCWRKRKFTIRKVYK